MHRKHVLNELRAARGNGLTLAQLERKLLPSSDRETVRRELPGLVEEAVASPLVKVIGIDQEGKIKLSRKAVLAQDQKK